MIAPLLIVVAVSAAAAQDALENRLEQNEYLLRHHRGYMAYLTQHEAVASAETALATMLVLTAPHDAVVQFESALNRTPAARKAFDVFHEALAGNNALDAAVSRLYRAEHQLQPLTADGRAALNYLHAHPAEALVFLQQPARGTRPLLALRQPLMHKDGVRLEMKAALEAIDALPAGHAAVFPWWALLAGNDTDVARTHEQLMSVLERHPNWFWIWHHHATAIQAEPAAREWLRYWHIRVSEEPELGPRYWQYITNAQQSGAQERTEDKWFNAHGAPPVWPPVSAPPDITSTGAVSPAHRPPKSQLMPDRPPRPAKPAPKITMPRIPQKPAHPIRPPLSK